MADGGTMLVIAQPRWARERMAKGKMEAKDGARAKEIGAKAAKEIIVRMAKVGAAKVGVAWGSLGSPGWAHGDACDL